MSGGRVRAPNGVDFWRGFALVTIFVNHVPGNVFERATHRNFGFSDSAELFVLLAGWSLYLSTRGRDGAPEATGRLLFRLGGRAVAVYAAQVLITVIALGLIAAAAIHFREPLFLEWHNAAAVFTDPVAAHLGLVLLTHQLGYFNILPLYVVLMALAPGIAVVDRLAPRLLLPLSGALWLAALLARLNLPTWPVEGEWFFSPLAWQFLFVIGFALARAVERGGFGPRVLRWLRPPAFLAVGAALGVALDGRGPEHAFVPWPQALFVLDKAYLSPLRLLHVLALMIAFAGAFAHLDRLLPLASRFLSRLGRHSLNVFCVGSVLGLAGQLVRAALPVSWALDATVVLTGIMCLGVTAWLSEWRDRAKPASPVAAELDRAGS